MLKRYLSILTMLSMIFMLTACSDSDSDHDDPKPTALQITSNVNTLPVGKTAFLNADVFYDDGSTINHVTAVWESMNPDIATVDAITGEVEGISKGQAIIKASHVGLVAEVTATITDAVLTSITLAPESFSIPIGQTDNFQVQGKFSDGSILTLTGNPDISWGSSAPGIVSFDEQGNIAALTPGSTNITATLDNVSSSGKNIVTVTDAIINFTISPDTASIPKGLTQQFTATGYLSDGTEKDITNQVVWKSEDPNIIATVEPGVFKGIAVNEGQISATFGNMISSDNKPVFTVTRPLLTSFEVEAPSSSQPLGRPVQFQAIAGFSSDEEYDVASYDQVYWQSSNPKIATVTSSGVVKGIAEGQVTISGLTTFAGVRNSKIITITPKVLDRVELTPENENRIISVEMSQQMNAFGVYSDGSTEENAEINWHTELKYQPRSGNPDPFANEVDQPQIRINPDGKLSFAAPGKPSTNNFVIITASLNGLSSNESIHLPGGEIKSTKVDNKELDFFPPLTFFQADGLGFSQAVDSEFQYATEVSQMTYEQAKNLCENISYNNHQDWYLPSAKELQNLFNLPFLEWGILSNYWSSTVIGEEHYVVYSDDGNISKSETSKEYIVTCARAR